MIIVRRHKQLSIATSAVLHIVVIAFVVIFKDVQWKSSSHKFDVVANSVRVDVVAMPKFTIQELKQMQKGAPQEVEEEVVEQEAPPAKDDFLVKKKKVDFMSLMKKLSKKSVEKSKAKKRPMAAKRKGNELGKYSGDIKKLVLSGNRLRKGTSIAGTGVGLNDGEFSQYLQKLPDWVRDKWKLPSYLAEKGLRCRIRIFLNKSGNLIRSEIIESSGEKEYDQRALEAVRLSTPFPPIGENISSRALRGDIVLGFPL